MADGFDFWIIDCGSIVKFMPLSESAKAHCADHFPDDCPMLGNAYCVEHRFAEDIVDDLIVHAFNMRSI